MQIIYSILVALSILSAPNHTYALSEDNLKDISITQEATRRAEVIKHIETQGKKDCNSIRGLSGELGCYQMLESTMKALAKKHNIEVKGYTYETQEKIVFEEMKSQVAKEIPRKDTFLQWNTGHFGTCSKGVNKYGVSFDSCSYVNKAMKIYSYLFLQ
jgi:muramidase (phage lysozyme)